LEQRGFVGLLFSKGKKRRMGEYERDKKEPGRERIFKLY
jgi:hypothetical protein